MKKNIKINRTLKLAVIGTLAIVLMYLVYSVVNLQNEESFKEEVKTVYEHSWEETIDWTSHLIPNPIIKESTLDKSRFIFKDFTDELTVEFIVPVSVSETVTFQGDAFLKGTLKSVYGEDQDLVWEKEAIFLKAEIIEEDDRILFKVTAHEDIMRHKEFLTSLSEEYTISGNYLYVFELIVDGRLVGETDSYDFKINPKVEYGLMNNITKGVETKSTVLEFKKDETVKILLPVNQNQLNLLYILIGLIVIGIVFMVLFTKTKPSKDAFDRLVDGLLKEYGDRMVALPKSLSLQYGNVMTIENEKDMIKTADEINQPVFYYYSNDAEERKLEMFVFDDVRVYYYNKFGISQ